MRCDGNAIGGNDDPLIGPDNAPAVELLRSNRVGGTKRFDDCAERHEREAWKNQNRKPLRSQSAIFGITISSTITFDSTGSATRAARSLGRGGHLHQTSQSLHVISLGQPVRQLHSLALTSSMERFPA